MKLKNSLGLAILGLLFSQALLADPPQRPALVINDNAICTNTGGAWNDCGSGCGPLNCDNYLNPPIACPAICVAQCECPADTLWVPGGGCQPIEMACQGAIPIDPIQICANTGGNWNDCGSGCGPTTCSFMPAPDQICPDVCDAHCECPMGFVWDQVMGCVDQAQCGVVLPPPPPVSPEELCTSTQGTVTCQPSQCMIDENGVEVCTSDCGFACICLDGFVFDSTLGCVPITNQDFSALCVETGGAVECGPPNCVGDVCDTSCPLVCVCPAGFVFDETQGCQMGGLTECPENQYLDANGNCIVQGPEYQLCTQTNGTWNTCGSSCDPIGCPIPTMDARPGAPEDISCAAVCVELCSCGENRVWDATLGCVDISTCDGSENGGTTGNGGSMVGGGNEGGNLDVGMDPNEMTAGTNNTDQEQNSTAGNESSSSCQSNQSAGMLVLALLMLPLLRRKKRCCQA